MFTESEMFIGSECDLDEEHDIESVGNRHGVSTIMCHTHEPVFNTVDIRIK